MADESPISRQDIIKDDALAVVRELTGELKALKSEMLEVAANARKMAEGMRSAGENKTLPKAKEDTEQLTLAQQELIKVQKQIALAQAKTNDEYIENTKILAKAKQALKDSIALGNQDALTVNKQTASRNLLKKALDKNIAAYSNLTSEEARNTEEGLRLNRVINQQQKEYDELSVSIGITSQRVGNYSGGILEAYNKINQLKNANKELIVLQGKLTKSTEAERLQYQELNIAIQNNLSQINYYNTAITTTTSKVQQLATQFLSAVGLIGGIFLVVQAIRTFINVNKELEKSLSDLQALTGATTEDLLAYKNAAIEIGAEQKRSAKDIVEAFKLVGGARPELLAVKEDLIAVTKEAVVLANASGLELPAAAEALAGSLNQLQLPAKDAGRVVNVLAAAAKEGAAEIPDITESYKDFGAVLKQANGSIEEGAALIEVLADRQIKGGEAGTALRNVLLKLSAVNALSPKAKDQLAKFGVDLVKVADNTVPLNERLKELGKISGDATAQVKVFGVENFVAGNIVLQSIPRFEQLTKAITGTNEAYRQAAVSTDNLDGDTKELAATTEAYAEELGSHTQGILRSIVQSFTFMVNVLRALPGFLSDNKALFISLALAVLAFNSQLIVTNANLLLLNARAVLTVARLAAMRTATIAFFTTFAANPLGLFLITISAVIAAVATYDKVSQRSVDLARQREKVNKDVNSELERTSKAYDDLTISIDKFVKLSKTQQDSLIEQVEFQKKFSLVMLERVKAQRLAIKTTAEELTGLQKVKKFLLGYVSPSAAVSESIVDSFKNVKEALDPVDTEIDKLIEQINKFDAFITDSKEQQNNETEAAAKHEKDAAYKLNKFRLEQAIKTQDELFKNEFAGEQERLDANGKRVQLQNSLADLERRHELASDKLTSSDKLLIREQYNAQVIENEKKGAQERSELSDKLFNDEMQKAEKNLQETVELYKSKLNEQVALIQDAVNKGVLSRTDGEKKIAQAVKDNAVELTKETIKLMQGLLNTQSLTASERKRIEQEIHDLQIKLIGEVYAAGKEGSKSFIEQLRDDLQKALTIYEQFAQGVNNLIQSITANRVAGIEKEIRASERQKDHELTLAGDNENARKRIELEAEKRRETLEKRRIDALRRAAIFEKAVALVQAGIKATLAVLNELSSGDPYTAFARAAAAGVAGAIEVAAIAAKPIPSYETGTLYHPGGAARVSEKGSELVESPSGRLYLTPAKETILPNLERGSKVYPHGETVRRLALSGAGNVGGQQVVNHTDKLIEVFVDEVRDLKATIRDSNGNGYPLEYFEENSDVLYKVRKVNESFIKRQRARNMYS